MNVVVILLALLAAPSAPPIATPSAASVAFSWFLGNWHCATALGSAVTMQFVAQPDGSVTTHTEWKNGAANGSFDQVFWPQSDGSWKTRQRDGRNTIQFDGAAPGFVDSAITFTGTQGNAYGARPERETFRVTGATAFEHTWYAQTPDGAWKPTSFAECTKV